MSLGAGATRLFGGALHDVSLTIPNIRANVGWSFQQGLRATLHTASRQLQIEKGRLAAAPPTLDIQFR